MKIHGSRYEHEPLPGKKLSGILLRFSFGIANVGYADLHPWPEYGDEPLTKQIDSLLRAGWTPLIQKCLIFAGHDAKARRQNRNLLLGQDLPTTHALKGVSHLTKHASKGGWHPLKIKMTPTTDLSQVPTDVRLRLDFNGTLKYGEFQKWWSGVSEALKARIDVIEDPYNSGEIDSNPRFYSDWIDNSSWIGKVMKPSREFSRGEYEQHRYKKVFFTHSLNHPLGQAAAIWEAARFYKKYPTLKQPCGFSKVPSKPFEAFNSAWKLDGPILKPAPGLGFGFDQQLADLKWERML